MLTENDIAHFRSTFTLFQKENGLAQMRDLADMLKHQGFEPTLEEIQQYISNISPNGSEWINFNDFTAIMA